ncbi:hypothetical protein [Mesorhizobium sp.]|uniref:hypothetical protein n=1 Tax=Mesorhizobium sp. TaxID=1871066 RepID=UPI000FEA3AC3|nr:hypothetical protein [Mesorhizobium sp.]RWA75832.1 MAG: hypothetical protein EOQ30_35125 [Mesorhizobium sp.]
MARGILPGSMKSAKLTALDAPLEQAIELLNFFEDMQATHNLEWLQTPNIHIMSRRLLHTPILNDMSLLGS